MIKILKFIFIAVLASVSVVIVWFYLSCPVYHFSEPQPFKGDSLYNPYDNIEGAQWFAGNFQVQSKVWMGLTNGRKNMPEAIWKAYRKMGYDIIAISDYQSINRVFKDSVGYVPVYEHGYGIFKTHQVCLGSRRVLWRDYPLGASLSQKQHILDLLGKDNDLVALAHPDLRNGYRVEELKYLSGYHLMEVLNGARISLSHWDSALSAGHPAFILADDDAHDIYKHGETGNYVTMVAGRSLSAQEIINSLKRGSAYGVRVLLQKRESDFIHKLPMLVFCAMHNDSLRVVFSDTALEIRFVGQKGRILGINRHSSSGIMPFRDEDTYIRVEAEFKDRAILYINPVFRYSGDVINLSTRAEVNTATTLWKRILIFLGTGISIFTFGILKKKYKRHEATQHT